MFWAVLVKMLELFSQEKKSTFVIKEILCKTTVVNKDTVIIGLMNHEV